MSDYIVIIDAPDPADAAANAALSAIKTRIDGFSTMSHGVLADGSTAVLCSSSQLQLIRMSGLSTLGEAVVMAALDDDVFFGEASTMLRAS